jgi:intracellular multiplication protein IcmV
MLCMGTDCNFSLSQIIIPDRTFVRMQDMAIRDVFKISRKTFVNPAGWIDYDLLKSQNQTIWEVLRNLFSKPSPVKEESFSAAMKRLKLTEKDVREGATNYRIFAGIFFIFGLLLFFYTFYLLFHHGAFLGWILGLAASTLLFAQAFKYDFWSLQMRRRKLGITFKEWKESLLGGKDTSA